MKLYENEKYKLIRSKFYNYNFNKITGDFARWGETSDIDPFIAPAPEIADIEITTKCSKNCPFCYKANTNTGDNMSLDTFKVIFDKLPKTLTQVAFGADSDATANPELFDMMWYCRQNGVIPNITVANVTEFTIDKLINVCGAIAVSRYQNKHECYDSIKMLHDHGFKQTNIHLLVSEETENWIWETFNDYLNGKIIGLNAIVLLALKQKGRGVHFNRLPFEKYKNVINYALDNNIPIGADSCSGSNLIKATKHRKEANEIFKLVDPCESFRMSIYIDVNGIAYPCSFSPNTDSYINGIDMLKVIDFEKEVWYGDMASKFREALKCNYNINGCISCPLFSI